jgi:hypothetical protein
MAKIRKFRTDILIDNDSPPNDDLLFIRSKGFRPTNILRAKIRELKAQDRGDSNELLDLSKKLSNLQNLIEKLLSFLDKKGLTEEFYKT